MKNTIFLKIKQNGLSWFISRLKREIRSPTFQFSKAAIDKLLHIRKMLSKSSTKPKADEFLYAIYDLDVSAITYNLTEFLIDAEYEARECGKRGFVIVFVPRSNDPGLVWKEYDSVIDSASKYWRFQNILLPLTSLAVKCMGVFVLPHRSDAASFVRELDVYPYLYDGINLRSIDIADFYRKLDRPNLFEGLRASPQGLKYIQAWLRDNRVFAPIITITIRNHAFDAMRNSNIEEWSRFARYLKSSGYHPIIIPDTDTAFSEDPFFDGIAHFRECAWNVGLRMALYESAFLNFFVPNGCAALAVFNPSCSYISMNNLPEGSIVTTVESLKNSGHPVGTNHKFATPNQRLSFKPDSYENILEEFNIFLGKNAEEPSPRN